MRGSGRFVAGMFAVCCVGIVSGCSDSPSLNAGPSAPPETIFAAGSINSGASERAREILQRGQANGGLTRLDLDEAAVNAMECLETAGITPQFSPPQSAHGLYAIGWGFDVGDGPDTAKADEFDAIANACVDGEYYPVAMTYADQPESLEAQDALREQWRVAGIECLVEAGVATDSNAHWDEVATALSEDFLARRDNSCFRQIGMGEQVS